MKDALRIAVIIPPIGTPNQERIGGILRYAATHPSWNVFLLGSHADFEALNDISRWHADGIIAMPEFFTDSELLTRYRARAYVVSNRLDFSLPKWCTRYGAVIGNNVAVGKVGAQFFLKREFRHFAYVGMPRQQLWAHDRQRGFQEELKRHGHTCAVFASDPDRSWTAEENALAQFLINLPKPCGLMAALDMRAKHVLDVCRLIGIDVPSQVSVLGVDNEATFCEWMQPSLSSIYPDYARSGYMLAEMLDQLLQDKTPASSSPLIKSYGIIGIVERKSTLDITGAARIISLAKDFIRTHAASDIDMEEIAAAAGCSTRALQRHFKKVTGETPVDVLIRRRLELVCGILERSTTPIDQIGDFCGFRSATYLKTTFKRHYGITMSEWRRKHHT